MPNAAENNCPFATTDWAPLPNGKFRVTQTCSKGPDAPPGRVIRATADPLDRVGNTKWRMNYFAGLIRREVRGRTHLCRLEPGPLASAHEWLTFYERFWSSRLDVLERILREDDARINPKGDDR